MHIQDEGEGSLYIHAEIGRSIFRRQNDDRNWPKVVGITIDMLTGA